jgi:predicted dehydrogenase
MTFRWGILGTGHAARKFVLGLRHSATGKAALVASRNRANAQEFAHAFSVPMVADTYDSCANTSEVDGLYIATPPTLHREQALLGISVGKPVLIEKPLAHNAEDAHAIINAARDYRVFCMEGMWTRFLPLVSHIKKLVEQGEIGMPRVFSGSFGKSNIPDKGHSVFNKELGGGAMLHRGIYPLSMACYLMGPVEEIVSTASIGETAVDEDSSIVLRHVRGGLSLTTASLRAQLANDFTIVGTHGTIHVHAPVYRPYRLTLTKTTPTSNQTTSSSRLESLKESTLCQSLYQHFDFLARLIRQGRRRTISRHYEGNGYHYEADEVIRCVQTGLGESPVMPLSDSLTVALITEKARSLWS